MRKKIVGVMGAGIPEATQDDLTVAYLVGEVIAKHGCNLLCGGMSGVMEESARGASEAGAEVIGIGPSLEKDDMNPYVTIPISTGMHAGRNFINILSSEIAIFVGLSSPGTLSELAHAAQLGTPSIVLNCTCASMEALVKGFRTHNIYFADGKLDFEVRLKHLLQMSK